MAAMWHSMAMIICGMLQKYKAKHRAIPYGLALAHQWPMSSIPLGGCYFHPLWVTAGSCRPPYQVDDRKANTQAPPQVTHPVWITTATNVCTAHSLSLPCALELRFATKTRNYKQEQCRRQIRLEYCARCSDALPARSRTLFANKIFSLSLYISLLSKKNLFDCVSSWRVRMRQCFFFWSLVVLCCLGKKSPLVAV